MRILLLNPPGDKVYLRDYYCSKVSKADYIYEPPDLLCLSAILWGKHDVNVLDAIALGLREDDCLKQIIEYKPDAVFFITGSVSYKKDFIFLSRAKSETDALFIGSGDIFMQDYARRLRENPFLDAILLDFTDSSVLDYLKGKQGARNIISKDDGRIIEGEVVRSHGEEFEIPVPRHELFPLGKYRYPFVKSRRFCTVLTDYGCPFKCRFCIMSTIGYKMRTAEKVIEELKHIKKLGVREIYFDDQTFAGNRRRTNTLLDMMIAEGLDFGWCCFSRVDVIAEGLLIKMKEAGCHTIMFGVESGSQPILDKYCKGIKLDDVLETFRLCKKHGFTIVATFIFGLPEETNETAEETIKFALNCGCDYASFNVAVPRLGTKLRKEALKKGLIDEDFDEMDQSGTAVLTTCELATDEVEAYKNRALRNFYFRPAYITGELLKIRSAHDLVFRVNGLMAILRNMLFS